MSNSASHAISLVQQAQTLWQSGRKAEAVQTLQRACELIPHDADAHLELALCYQKEGLAHDALALMQKAAALAPQDVRCALNLGVQYHMLNRSQEALACFEKAETLGAKPALLAVSKAYALQALGRDEEAAEHFRTAYAIDPARTYVLRDYSRVVKLQEGDPMLQATREALTKPHVTGIARAHALYALAKFYEDQKNLPAAFDTYQEANQLLREGMSFDAQHYQAYTRRICDMFSAEQCATLKSAPSTTSPRPIFIIGMPRSGTSLTEQVLASHSQVFGAGELPTISMIAHHHFAGAYQKPFPDYAPQMQPDHLAVARDHYLEQLRVYDVKSPFIIDKMPGNYAYVGLIHLMFPDAPIIHCTRDPVDVCWSLYRTYFENRHPYSYDLREIGSVYNAYRDMMAHWHHVLPNRMYDISYEALVNDLEGEARKLVAHCGLEWEPTVLDYQKTERNINTASSAQARKPLYKTSIKSWEPIADRLASLIETLKDGGSLL